MTADPGRLVFWLAGRSAGAVAMLLVTACVVLGLAMAGRLVPPRLRRDTVKLHEHLALVALAAILAHGAFLAADPWLKAGVTGVAVPFKIGYRPLWTGLGIIAGYLAAALALSFYIRRRIGPRTWRRMHRLTVAVYGLGLAHTIGAGTDAAIPIVRTVLLVSAVPIAVLLAVRLTREAPPRRDSRRRVTAEPYPPASAATQLRTPSIERSTA